MTIKNFAGELNRREYANLKEKVVTVTGASEGIGKAMAIKLAENGVKVAFI